MTPFGPLSAVLFDIDGTLLTGSSAHITYLMKAIADETGVENTFHMEGENPVVAGTVVAGFTDCQLLEHLIPGTEPSHGAMRARIMDEYGKAFAQDLGRGSLEPGTAVPGAGEMLAAFRQQEILLGLSTGNASAVASAKLRATGLADVFSFDPELGFGDRLNSRTQVVGAALQGLKNLPSSEGVELSRDSIALVGDTVADMESARAYGLVPVGVLTGAASASALSRAGAEHVLESSAELLKIG